MGKWLNASIKEFFPAHIWWNWPSYLVSVKWELSHKTLHSTSNTLKSSDIKQDAQKWNKRPVVPVSLILDKRAKIPGKSSSRSFISFHCLSSLDSALTAVTESSVSAADFISLHSFLLDVSGKRWWTGGIGLILCIIFFSCSSCWSSRKGDATESDFGFARWLRSLLYCVTY